MCFDEGTLWLFYANVIFLFNFYTSFAKKEIFL